MRLFPFLFFLLGFAVSTAQKKDSIFYPNYQLEEVTVIANRIINSAGRPYALTELDSSLVNQPFQNVSIKERLLQVPGVYVQNAYNFAQDARISIRGFGANAAFGIRGIKLMVDGIPETTPDGTGQLDNLNLDQIGEVNVIRGSASSLFGNASGGAIILNSNQFEKNYFTYQSMSGSYGFLSESLSGGINKGQTTYQGNVRFFESAGFRDHSQFRQLNARFAVNHQFSNRLSAVFIAEFVDSPEAKDAGGLTLEEAEMDFRMARDRNLLFDAGESITQWKLGSSLKWQWSDQGTLNTYAFFNRRTFDGKLPFERSGIIALERDYFGVGNSIDLKTGPHTLKAGYDILSQIDDRIRYDNLRGAQGARVFDQQESFFNAGFFLLDHVELNDWFFSAGLRFDVNDLSTTDHFLEDGDDSGDINMNNWSYQVGAGKQLSPGFQAFINHSTSFETPTLNQLSNRPDNSGGFENLKAAAAQNIEGGLRWKKKGLRAELVGFFTFSDGELVPYELADFPERTFFRNAGETLRRGIEFAAAYQHNKLSVHTTYTYSKFTFEDYVENDVDLAGFRLPGIPEHHANVNLIYQPIPNLSFSLPIQYVGNLWADNQNETAVENYLEASIMASYQINLRKLLIEPQMGIRNLLNQTYFDNIRINAFGNRFYEPAPGRNFYVGVKMRFSE